MNRSKNRSWKRTIDPGDTSVMRNVERDQSILRNPYVTQMVLIRKELDVLVREDDVTYSTCYKEIQSWLAESTGSRVLTLTMCIKQLWHLLLWRTKEKNCFSFTKNTFPSLKITKMIGFASVHAHDAHVPVTHTPRATPRTWCACASDSRIVCAVWVIWTALIRTRDDPNENLSNLGYSAMYYKLILHSALFKSEPAVDGTRFENRPPDEVSNWLHCPTRSWLQSRNIGKNYLRGWI